MDEQKETNVKKIKIKNKKEATKVLSKNTTSKAKKTTAKKTSTKKKNTPKKTIKKEEKLVTKEQALVTKNVPEKVKENTKEKKKSGKQEVAKTNKKKEEKTKLVLPKEWEKIGKQQETKTQEKAKNIKGKLKSSLFEEVDEKTFIIKKEKEKETIKKALLTALIVLVSVILIFIIILKFDKGLKESLKKYDAFVIGEKVKLKDNSIWYVVSNTDESEKSVKLLKESNIDTNNDKVIDNNDKKVYNSDNVVDYDEKNKSSIAFYLNDTYKKDLESAVGKVNEVSLLTSKEYVKIREKMGFGYDWTEGNWLANNDLDNWWILSDQDEKVYAVTSTGMYKLYNPESSNYIRPVIVIDKEFVAKVEEVKDEEKK